MKAYTTKVKMIPTPVGILLNARHNGISSEAANTALKRGTKAAKLKQWMWFIGLYTASFAAVGGFSMMMHYVFK